MNSAIYVGSVAHRRFFPRGHRFTYGVYYLWLDLAELTVMDRTVPGFGYNRAAPFAFHDRDHGPRDGSPLRPWLEGYLLEAGIDLDGGPVRMNSGTVDATVSHTSTRHRALSGAPVGNSCRIRKKTDEKASEDWKNHPAHAAPGRMCTSPAWA